MLFQNNFYTVKSEDLSESTANFNIELNGDHKIFEGHFPDNPITPGVVQMEIVTVKTVNQTKYSFKCIFYLSLFISRFM